MYEFVKNKDILKYIFDTSSKLVNELKIKINNENYVHIEIEVVGNKNLIMRDSSNPIDVDYSIIITKFPQEGLDPKTLKDYLIKNFNQILKKYNLEDCLDEVSTIKVNLNLQKEFPSFNLNLGIVVNILGESNRLVHRYKKKYDSHIYSWKKLTTLEDVDKKVELLKQAELYDELRDVYKIKRNTYLKSNDLDNHPAILIYVESVNELFASLINIAIK